MRILIDFNVLINRDFNNNNKKVIEIMGKTLEVFDLDGRIPAFGFGDAETKDRKVFSFTVLF